MFEKPTAFVISANFSPSGNRATDSGKYEYALESFEKSFPIVGVILLK